jgi:tetratricopeptide (TPR) repeat protein
MKGDKSFMKHFPKMFVLALLALSITLFSGAAIDSAYAESMVQDAFEESEETPYTEEEYNAYIAADQEADALKKGELLIAFMDEYPESTLMTYINAAYEKLLFDCYDGGKYQELETLAEQWNNLHPNDPRNIAYIVTAAGQLGHNEKLVQYLQELYTLQPTADRALHLAKIYKGMGNDAEYLEWIEKVLEYPEHAGNFALRYDLVQYYVREKNYTKAAEYARMTLEAIKLVQQPSAETLKSMRTVQNACHHLIGIQQYEEQQYAEAIKSFQQALKAETYSEGYYYIGMCQRNLDQIDDAMVSLAKADLEGGEVAPKAKEYLEKLYKALHNNTLIGIDKIYRKAKEQLEAAKEPNSNMNPQESEATVMAENVAE